MSYGEMKYATLRVYGREMDPAIITEALGVKPSSTQRRGDRVGAKNREREIQVDGWFLTSRGSFESPDMVGHIAWLLDHVAGSLPRLQDLSEVTLVNLFCCWHVSEWNEGCRIESSMLLELGRLGVSLDFDIYGASNGEGSSVY